MSDDGSEETPKKKKKTTEKKPAAKKSKLDPSNSTDAKILKMKTVLNSCGFVVRFMSKYDDKSELMEKLQEMMKENGLKATMSKADVCGDLGDQNRLCSVYLTSTHFIFQMAEYKRKKEAEKELAELNPKSIVSDDRRARRARSNVVDYSYKQVDEVFKKALATDEDEEENSGSGDEEGDAAEGSSKNKEGSLDGDEDESEESEESGFEPEEEDDE
jgi:hypothetical protein